MPLTKPPWDTPGLHDVDEGTLARYVRDEHRFPPYTYASQFCAWPSHMAMNDRQQLDGRVLTATDRESLMGYRPGHTMPGCRKLSGKFATRRRDTLRCGLIGNAFHTLPVATLLGCLLDEAGSPDVYKSPAQLQVDFC